MFGKLLKQKNNNKVIAKDLYSCALKNTRKEIFYTKYGVPDSFEGRFDLLVLHIFLIINRIMNQKGGKELSQAIFDVTFQDMDQTLREMGVGDVSVPKYMKRMMKAFNGRMHIYQMAVDPTALEGIDLENLQVTNLKEALARNIYGVDLNNLVDKKPINLMYLFVKSNLTRNNEDEIMRLMSGHADFINSCELELLEEADVG